MSSWIVALKLLLVGALGYLVIALGQVLVLEVLLGGDVHVDTSPSVLLTATLGSIMSGLVGGSCAAWWGGKLPMRHVAAVIAFLAVDTVSIIAGREAGADPVWFDLGGSLTLILATVAGGWLQVRLRRSEVAAA